MKNVNTNLRPFRIVQPYAERPFFTLVEGSGDKGMITKWDNGLQIGTTGVGGSDYALDLGDSLNTSSVNGVVSTRWKVPYRITAATSGTTKNQVAGVLLNNVRETDENGEKLINHKKNADARELTLSGEAVSLAREGFFLVSGVVGTPAAGSGAAVADAGNGKLKVIDPLPTGNQQYVIGTFAGPKDNAGFAPVEIKL